MPSAKKRLSSILQTSPIIHFDKDSRFIILSDCHRGQGNASDNFMQNQNLFFGALEYYYDKGFTYIELGDGDELWENRQLKSIIYTHSDAFWLMSKFYQDNRFYMLSGNHDIVKRRPSFSKNNYSNYYCDNSKCYVPLFPNLQVYEGLILENINRNESIFLVHGHQGDLLNDTLWPLARFLVRYFWRTLELVGFLNPFESVAPNSKKEKVDKRMSTFAEKEQMILIAGHTHRPIFSTPGNGLYFNDGSCVHPRCITGIEIENESISLIKWSVCIGKDRNLFVCRQVIEGPVPLKEYYYH